VEVHSFQFTFSTFLGQDQDRLAQALLQEEVLEREQVLAIVNGTQNTQGGAGGEQASQ
jgi:hypothetical protein